MEKRIGIGMKLPPSLVDEVDRCRNAMEFPPDRTQVIEKLLWNWVRDQRTQGNRTGVFNGLVKNPAQGAKDSA